MQNAEKKWAAVTLDLHIRYSLEERAVWNCNHAYFLYIICIIPIKYHFQVGISFYWESSE